MRVCVVFIILLWCVCMLSLFFFFFFGGVVVVVEWLYYSKRIVIVRWADLSDFFRSFSSVKCVFCFTSNENCHFSSEKRLPPKTGC